MHTTQLKVNASNIIYELLNHNSIDELKDGDALTGLIDSSVDSLCTYTSECIEMTDELGAKYGDYLDDCEEVEFKAYEWQNAVRSYAMALCRVALQDETAEVITELLENIEEFEAVVNDLGGDPDKAFIGDCAYGWAVHNYEHINGLMVWSDERNNSNGCFNPELLEGELIAVSYQLPTGQYINTCWTPEEE